MNWKLVTELKIFKDRAVGWASLYSFFMMYYLFLEKIYSGDSLQLVQEYVPASLPALRATVAILPVILIAVCTIYDIKYIVPREQEYYFQRNPEWNNRNK